jgi:hypothetical protein
MVHLSAHQFTSLKVFCFGPGVSKGFNSEALDLDEGGITNVKDSLLFI